jgi:hypothetical protein
MAVQPQEQRVLSESEQAVAMAVVSLLKPILDEMGEKVNSVTENLGDLLGSLQRLRLDMQKGAHDDVTVGSRGPEVNGCTG